MKGTTPTAPTIHLNGSDRKDLQAKYSNAFAAVNDALLALQECAPHMRDFYIGQKPVETFDRARAEHAARVQALLDVQTDLLSLCITLDQ